jgi:hypothetical protein
VIIGWVWIGFWTYWPSLWSISNYSATAGLHNLQITTSTTNLFQPALSSPAVPWQRLLTVEILQLLALTSFFPRVSFRTACQLFPQLSYSAISSQPPLQSSTALSIQHTALQADGYFTPNS